MARVHAVRDRAVLSVSALVARRHGSSRTGAGAGGEVGSASPIVIAIIAVVVCLAGALAHVGAGLIADAQAQGVADVAALAAARVDRDSRAQGYTFAGSLARGCQTAAEVSARNGASVADCERGADASVIVVVNVARGGWSTSATASARAGAAWR